MGRHKKNLTAVDGTDETVSRSTPSPIEGTSPSGVNTGLDIPAMRDEAKAEKEKRRYKKKKKEAEAVPDPELVKYAEGFALFSGMILDLAVARMPNPLPATETEKKVWADATSAIVVKYLPSLGEWKEEAAFIAVAAIVFLPRALKKESHSLPVVHELPTLIKLVPPPYAE